MLEQFKLKVAQALEDMKAKNERFYTDLKELYMRDIQVDNEKDIQ